MTPSDAREREVRMSEGSGKPKWMVLAAILIVMGAGLALFWPKIRYAFERRVALGKVAELPLGVSQRARGKIRPFAVRVPGGLFVVRALDPDSRCPLQWNAPTGEFLDTCRGSRYDLYGNVVSGPAKHPLERLKVTVTKDGTAIADDGIRQSADPATATEDHPYRPPDEWYVYAGRKTIFVSESNRRVSPFFVGLETSRKPWIRLGRIKDFQMGVQAFRAGSESLTVVRSRRWFIVGRSAAVPGTAREEDEAIPMNLSTLVLREDSDGTIWADPNRAAYAGPLFPPYALFLEKGDWREILITADVNSRRIPAEPDGGERVGHFHGLTLGMDVGDFLRRYPGAAPPKAVKGFPFEMTEFHDPMDSCPGMMISAGFRDGRLRQIAWSSEMCLRHRPPERVLSDFITLYGQPAEVVPFEEEADPLLNGWSAEGNAIWRTRHGDTSIQANLSISRTIPLMGTEADASYEYYFILLD